MEWRQAISSAPSGGRDSGSPRNSRNIPVMNWLRPVSPVVRLLSPRTPDGFGPGCDADDAAVRTERRSPAGQFTTASCPTSRAWSLASDQRLHASAHGLLAVVRSQPVVVPRVVVVDHEGVRLG